MTPVERYKYLQQYWKNQVAETAVVYDEAVKNHTHWLNRLVEAEIAEKLVQEDKP